MSPFVPMVSVILPVYNSEKYVLQAIESILNQSFKDFELILYNDGSEDQSDQIIRGIKDPRIRYFSNTVNTGLVGTLNKALQVCKGRYVARMDADDISHPKRLEKQVRFLEENPATVLVATRLELINEQGAFTGYWNDDFETLTAAQIKKKLPVLNCIGHPTIMIRQEIILKYGYTEQFNKSEDWGLWLRLLADGHTIAKLEDVLLKYRIHTNSITVKANSINTSRKILHFKLSYLTYKIRTFNFRGTDAIVLKSFFKSLARYLFPQIYNTTLKIFETRPKLFIQQYLNVKRAFRTGENKASLLCFFPFYNTGGAESVHSSILEALAHKKPITLITGVSAGNAMLNDFKKSSLVVDVAHLLKWNFSQKWLVGVIRNHCFKNIHTHLFGSNSYFFYQMVEHLGADAIITDLIHAFMHAHENGSEKWSLPVVHKLNNRVVINKKTHSDLENQYSVHQIPQKFVDRVICINNFTDKKVFEEKSLNGPLNFLYVGRASAEKRIHLITKAARTLGEKKVAVVFHFVGPATDNIAKEDLPYCVLHGEITDKRRMDALYNMAHVLVITSSREGFPMVIMEGMMAGVVPLATNVGGIAEHVLEGNNGLIIQDGESDAIVNQIIEAAIFYLHDRPALQVLSKNAHQYALNNFSKEKFFHAYQHLIK